MKLFNRPYFSGFPRIICPVGYRVHDYVCCVPVQQTHTGLIRHKPLAWLSQLVPLHLPLAPMNIVSVKQERVGSMNPVRDVKIYHSCRQSSRDSHDSHVVSDDSSYHKREKERSP